MLGFFFVPNIYGNAVTEVMQCHKKGQQMNDLTQFAFRNATIRVVTLDGHPWFVAADLAAALAVSNIRREVGKNLADDEKRNMKLHNSRGRANVVISESGLYKLTMRSDKPEAKAFQDWVTRDVLPAIRKDGGYVMGEEKVATGEMSEDELVEKALLIMAKKIERLSKENAAMSDELNNLTIDEFRALRHEYWSHAQRCALGKLAATMMRNRGSEPIKQHRKINTQQGPRMTAINVYPRAVLEEALDKWDLLTAA